MNYNPYNLINKTIFITGASSGIGKAIAFECSKMGAKLLITGRDKERLADTYSHLEGSGHLMFAADLSVENELKNLAERLPVIDGFINSAGIYRLIPFQFINREEIKKIFEINFTAPVTLCQGLVKLKKIKEGSSIVFISSIAGNMISAIGASVYSASKGAINGMIKGMALDLANYKIRVNSIIPGMIETNLTSEKLTAEQIQNDIKRYPLKRYGKPEEVAYAAIFLLSDASKWITGTNLLIDGGFTLL